MKVGKALEVLAVNLILLLGLYFVTSDLAERTAYAAGQGYSYFFTPSVLLETSTLVEGGQNLQSPLTLAWLQVILVLLLVLDASYVYGWIHGLRKSPGPGGQQGDSSAA